MKAVFYLLLLLQSFEQLPKLHGPIWHLREVSFSLTSCRLFCESFCYRQVSHSCYESPAGLQAPCSLLLPFLHWLHLAHVLQLLTCTLEESSPCAVLLQPFKLCTTQHTNSQQWSNTGCHVQTMLLPRQVGADDPWGHIQPGILWNTSGNVLSTYLSAFESFACGRIMVTLDSLMLPGLSTNCGSQLEMQEIKWVWKNVNSFVSLMSSKRKSGARDLRYFEERLISWPRDLHWLNMIFSFFFFYV